MGLSPIVLFTEIKTEIRHTRVRSNNNEKLLSQHRKSKEYTRDYCQITATLRVRPTKDHESDKPAFAFDLLHDSFHGTFQTLLSPKKLYSSEGPLKNVKILTCGSQ